MTFLRILLLLIVTVLLLWGCKTAEVLRVDSKAGGCIGQGANDLSSVLAFHPDTLNTSGMVTGDRLRAHWFDETPKGTVIQCAGRSEEYTAGQVEGMALIVEMVSPISPHPAQWPIATPLWIVVERDVDLLDTFLQYHTIFNPDSTLTQPLFHFGVEEIFIVETFFVIIPTSDEGEEVVSLYPYPNPSISGRFNLRGLKAGTSWIVYDSRTRVVLEGETSIIDLSGFSSGVYFIAYDSLYYPVTYRK